MMYLLFVAFSRTASENSDMVVGMDVAVLSVSKQNYPSSAAVFVYDNCTGWLHHSQ